MVALFIYIMYVIHYCTFQLNYITAIKKINKKNSKYLFFHKICLEFFWMKKMKIGEGYRAGPPPPPTNILLTFKISYLVQSSDQ